MSGSAAEQPFGSLTQRLDQGVGPAAAGQDRGELVAPRREVAHRPVEIYVDDAPAANQIIDLHRPAAGLQELRLDHFAAPARLRARLGLDDEALPRVVADLAGVIGDQETGESLADVEPAGLR